MKLYGTTYTRREIEACTGRISQIGGLRRFTLNEGREKGVELIQLRTGAGLSCYISPSRGLDISLAEFGGVPLSWQSANGDVHPAYFDPAGLGWLRSAVGGLLMTCGLSSVGSPGEGEGLHGRAHHLPAGQVTAESSWQGDDYVLRVSGLLEETAIFGENLQLRREILARLGENCLTIRDVVENVGFDRRPHMILYHFNFGFPLLGPQTTIQFPSGRVIPREPTTPTAGYDQWQAPEVGYAERVYYHQEMPSGRVTTTIHNPAFPTPTGRIPLSLALCWSTEQLPRLVQWKMAGAGVHVLGIEPANCYVEGRAIERERGTLAMLEPGEQRTYELTLTINSQ